MSWQDDYLRRFYWNLPGWVNGTVEFHDLCRHHLAASSRVLELGPSTGGQTTPFLASVAAEVAGLDVDPAVQNNPHLSSAHIYREDDDFPFEPDSFDAVVSDYVVEHLVNPLHVLKAAHRILKPGGVLLFRTPNARHYVSLLGRLLPDRLSVWARGHGSDHRVYPRYFRCNTARRCRRLLEQAGFRVESLRLVEKEPSYGMGSRVLFLLMTAYERLVNSTGALAGLRANLLVCARKPER